MPRSRGAALFSSWNRPPFIRETAPIFGRTHAQGALERAAHRFARAEAALRGNLVDGGPALFQSPPRPFDAKFLDIARGSHARRGVDPILTHEDGIDIDAHLRIALGQAQAAAPVGGGALAVEESGLCKDECPGADRGEPADALGDALEPADETVVVERRVDAASASDEERVDSAPDLPEAAIHDEPDPR